jgi:hypothetical protein
MLGVLERAPRPLVSDWEINRRFRCHRAKTSQKGEGRLGLGVQTTAVHTDARMQKEEKVRLRLTQEHDVASELVGHARHSHVAMAAIEPPTLPG